MQTITAADGLAGDDLWVVFSALRLLDEAADAVGDAAAEAERLGAESSWENDGVRALRRKLSQLHVELGEQRGELMVVRDRVARTAFA
ncbi:hypothetical protein Q9R19_09645 [Microbacterium sp. ARD32]|uniref:hypothetical protein n=1 Tax=Microbacterium sp. ARD32 TaxID=2962577 RepID=UPI0028813425|nr:hypothetical protein [Microbacterium sp. ARD32]MDT0157885.1 hypothetical protein [Microbacterium sp. ARD32]